MPVNYLLIESLRRFHSYYGGDFRIECPTGSGQFVTIAAAADELAESSSAPVSLRAGWPPPGGRPQRQAPDRSPLP